MYPLHKYLPTPFGTYLLYIDNGPTRVPVNKDLPQLPSYQTVKDYGRKLHQHQQHASTYQAFSKPVETNRRAQTKPATAPTMKNETIQQQRKKDAFTPSSTMPNSIWSPKVKRMHLSYNMRQLWHTGQPVKDPPSKVIEVDALTGAEIKQNAPWYKGRASNEHEGMNITPSSFVTPGHSRHQSADSLGVERVAILPTNSIPSRKSRRPKVPPNTVTNSPVLSEAYKRQASQLGSNMVPKRHKRSSQSRKSQLHNERRPQVNRETQTTPYRFANSSMDYSEVSISPSVRSRSNERSTSVPLGSSNTSRSKDCMEKTGLPPILETEAPLPVIHEPRALQRVPVTVESSGWEQRSRRVQEFRNPEANIYIQSVFTTTEKPKSCREMCRRRFLPARYEHDNYMKQARVTLKPSSLISQKLADLNCHFPDSSPTFPVPSNGNYWEEMNKRRYTSLPASHNLLPFTWKEPKRFPNADEKRLQERKSELDKILPVISRMPTVPRV